MNQRLVAGSRPTKVVCITLLTGNRMGWTVRCGRPPLLLPSCRKLEFRLSALMDSDLAWVNGKSGKQSWRYADAFQRSIISEAIYHFTIFLCIQMFLILAARNLNFCSAWYWRTAGCTCASVLGRMQATILDQGQHGWNSFNTLSKVLMKEITWLHCIANEMHRSM